MGGGEADALRAAVDARLAAFDRERVGARLWAADPTLWKADDPGHQKVIANALGWLTVFDDVADQLDDLAEFVAEVRDDGLTHAVLLGMGGSSLAPEVLACAFGAGEDGLDLSVLDTTDPAAIAALEERADLTETLFIVSSKSGGTTETSSLHAYFYQRAHDELGHEAAGRHFIAVTDEGTSLQEAALEQEFRAIFVNPSDIGGRYSALSFFGLVPAALLGLDVDELLDRGRAMAALCGADVPAADNPALRLGAFLGEGGLTGRDKVTLVTPPVMGGFGSWLEQLIAESTGKEGTGLFPVDVEPLGAPDIYGDDRQFVALRVQDEDDTGQGGKLDALEQAGFPVERLELTDLYDIGAQFVLWELAVPVAGLILGIDPFDQPNVQESKDNTRRVLAELEGRGDVPLPHGAGGQAVAFTLGDDGLEPALRELVGGIAPPDYVALQAWLTPGRRCLARVAGDARAASRPPQGRHQRRLRAALPALDRPVPQGRAGDRCLPAALCGRGTGAAGARRALRLRTAQGRAGSGRPRGAGRPRQARAARGPRRRSRRRPARVP